MLESEWRPESLIIAEKLKEHAEKRGTTLVPGRSPGCSTTAPSPPTIAGPRTFEQWTSYFARARLQVDGGGREAGRQPGDAGPCLHARVQRSAVSGRGAVCGGGVTWHTPAVNRQHPGPLPALGVRRARARSSAPGRSRCGRRDRDSEPLEAREPRQYQSRAQGPGISQVGGRWRGSAEQRRLLRVRCAGRCSRGCGRCRRAHGARTATS